MPKDVVGEQNVYSTYAQKLHVKRKDHHFQETDHESELVKSKTIQNFEIFNLRPRKQVLAALYSRLQQKYINRILKRTVEKPKY